MAVRMTALETQTWLALATVGIALASLLWRALRRRRPGCNCAAASGCPASHIRNRGQDATSRSPRAGRQPPAG
jgi:hypothetical protein